MPSALMQKRNADFITREGNVRVTGRLVHNRSRDSLTCQREILEFSLTMLTQLKFYISSNPIVRNIYLFMMLVV
jgi:hypothetical protein